MWRWLWGTLRALPGLRRTRKGLNGDGALAGVTLPAMERAVVRCVPSEPKLSVSFAVGDGSTRQVQRDQAEPLGRALARIAFNASRGRKAAKKSSKKARRAEPGPDPQRPRGGRPGRLHLRRPPPLHQEGDRPGPRPHRHLQHPGRHLRPDGALPDGPLPLLRSLLAGTRLPAKPAQEGAGPGACTFDARHLYTKRVTGPGLVRTVTYNILADIYAQTELSRTVLYPYCAPYSLELDYRQNLLKKELAGYNADIICLQEVDKSVFTDSLGPALDAFGLEGLFKLKEKQHEGLATFYRRDKFRLLSQHDIALNQALLEDPLHEDLRGKLASHAQVQEKVLQRSSVLQVSVLQSASDPSRKICVANTHLYWHPKGPNIRLIQTAISLAHIRHVVHDMYPDAPLIFCGDFNSTPSTGMYSFISNGSIAEDHEDWVSDGEESCCSMSLTHPFKLKSACGEPAYTNYVGGFHGCLDYIFIDANALEVEQVIPLPSHEEVTTHQALPSVSHPSDHIALICDLKWK
nr:2',5'-phosphodiesterase 12 [Pogona vitticeps]